MTNKNSLVIYKNNPAQVIEITNFNKVKIKLQTSKILFVHQYEIDCIYPNNFKSFKSLTVLPKQHRLNLIELWGKLQGKILSYQNFVQLVYNEIYNPSSAFSCWKLLKKYYPFFIYKNLFVIVTKSELIKSLITFNKKEKENKKKFIYFIENIKNNLQYKKSCISFIKEIEDFALNKSCIYRVFIYLKLKPNIENAKNILIKLGFWKKNFDCYYASIKDKYICNTNYIKQDIASLYNKTMLSRKLEKYQCFAIDNESTNDSEDAISVDKEGKIWIHIADPGSCILNDSYLDILARNRNRSLYFPHNSITMLTKHITNIFTLKNICNSLSIGFILTKNNNITDIEIKVLKVKINKISYSYMDKNMHIGPYKIFKNIAYKFRRYRKNAGAIFLDWPNMNLKVNVNKTLIVQNNKYLSKNIVKAFMIMGGVALAKFAIKNKIMLPFIKQNKTCNLNILKKISWSQKYYIKKNLSKLTYDTQPNIISSLGIKYYIKFTNPLRKYEDLLVHQQLYKFLHNKTLMSNEEIKNKMNISSINYALYNKKVLLSIKHWLCIYLLNNKNWKGKAIILEYNTKKQYVNILIPSFNIIHKIYTTITMIENSLIFISIQEVDLLSLKIKFKIL